MNALEQAFAEYSEAVAQLGDVGDNIGVLEIHYVDEGRARTAAATLLAQYTASTRTQSAKWGPCTCIYRL
ncbi:hypothetical protein CHLRE_15g643515v5 [Chlamydomonas reinhardtii]|uniref:Uncharacterized protein n=1 Tax=Chlamydomonas reinhardtii TaxID=3055 RepID=A0A2K3CWY5_CHLRE|nr:uncharacterized protein CHLRE_15g643515v5 [Chlamydomonas reinhardtii]PNW72804.1 hypothetical protein CHLRE_15g643515v5 [Chlamydomonas reinhardtii]